MTGKPIELPIAIAKAFVRNMSAFHAEESPIMRDEIASGQGKNERPLKLHEVKQTSKEMKDQA
jgi:hypothetical protein